MLEGALERQAGAIELVGEPGIGKTRLLAELEAMADAPRRPGAVGQRVRARARPAVLGLRRRARRVRARAAAAPCWSRSGDELDRVLSQSAARSRRRAPPRAPGGPRPARASWRPGQPLVLMLDDLHWADPASLELLGTLLRRPPQAPVLLALAVRPRQVPEKLLPALERANRAGTLTRIELGALTRDDAKALHGEAADAGLRGERREPVLPPAARPLARPHRPGAARRHRRALRGAGAARRDARRLLQGAAVAGDPFAPELAAAAAGIGEAPRSTRSTSCWRRT